MNTIISLDTDHIRAEQLETFHYTLPWQPRWWKEALATNYILSTVLVILTILFFLISTPNARHWMIIPIGFCGILAGSDIVRWFRGEIDVFDPKFFVSLFLFINCFLAPFMHVYYGIYGKDFYLTDWPYWFGLMGFLNYGGIVLFKMAQRFFYNRARIVKSYWQINPGQIFTIGLPVILISFISLLIIHFIFGGLVKVMGEYMVSQVATQNWHYLSVLRMFGDPFVPLLMMLFICWLHINKPDRSRSTMTVLIILGATFVLQFLSVGMRGSRSIIIVGVLTVAIITHFTVRPISRKWILVGLAFTMVFLYLYDFRKKMGTEGWKVFSDSETRQAMAEEMGVGLHTTLMGDMARADVQAYMLYNLSENPDINYQYKHGWTYVMSVLSFIPRAVWPTKPLGVKRYAGAELLQGYSGQQGSTRQYGLAGEAMLNFGYFGIIPAYIVLGVILGTARKKMLSLTPSDARLFLVPILLLMIQSMIISDSDNWMFGLIRKGFLPFIVFYFGSVKIRLNSLGKKLD